MARTKASRGASTFKLRSQGGTFKMMGATPLYKNKIIHGEGKDWQHDHREKPAHSDTPEAHNVKPAPLKTGEYKGLSKAEVRSKVLANNKGKKAGDKKRLDLNTEIKSWRIQNRETGTENKETTTTTKPKQAFTEAKKEIKVEEMYHGAGGKIMNPDGSVNVQATKSNVEHLNQ